MKDNKLPVMSDEEREKAWKNLKVGDTLVYIEWNDWLNRYTVRHINITKQTSKGSFRLENGTLLKFFEPNFHIITTELNSWIQKNNLENQVMKMIGEAVNSTSEFTSNLTYEDAKTLKEILERTIKR